MSLLQQITQSLRALDYDFAAQEKPLPGLIERYLLLIEKWNKIHNLTAIRNLQDMLYQHVMDSLAVLPHITGPQIIDVGSGAGLPGIPIALARPDWQVLLVESNQKKASFLQQIKIELALQNVAVIGQRIEDIRLDKKVNTIITRAFSGLGEFIDLSRQLAVDNDENCRWVAMKANCSESELKQIQAPFSIEKSVSLDVPGLDAARQLIIIKKLTSD
ncbi:16S rRNA (guanine(527)-N(7))-methyltransferase RsmG [Nitrosomonas sp.]|jgi:16S rRNA (guanine527-N7)-methyltransferase|uniref:16S rRNA (guanine(527)-N(7))-methyltransferase RsmG n=1 Tax=Nitrosomonas sp. TaxID=42353 RepID=UPI002725E9B3|nr:16S rRNA (guanine(527)-N(7))-methyltransferase RsmG [Nitrosomonas sp.]MDO8893960.1 16S rRNA (guanine(527)-N(7))-methyltransferase RsmG [Nitrosomonas sp.]MDP1785742.1 16S rRNA (guanine(527)-N(7))-methyltransferase RsmG [Nitrosomonas sp.]